MKGKILLIILLITIVGCKPREIASEINTTKQKYPAVYGIDVYYCEGMSYTYDYKEINGTWDGYCVFPDDSECEAFDFVSAECGTKFTLCEIKGYTLKIGLEVHETFNKSYAICIFPDNSYCKEVDFFYRRCHVTW